MSHCDSPVSPMFCHCHNGCFFLIIFHILAHFLVFPFINLSCQFRHLPFSTRPVVPPLCSHLIPSLTSPPVPHSLIISPAYIPGLSPQLLPDHLMYHLFVAFSPVFCLHVPEHKLFLVLPAFPLLAFSLLPECLIMYIYIYFLLLFSLYWTEQLLRDRKWRATERERLLEKGHRLESSLGRC